MSDDEAFDIAGSLALKDEDDYSDSSSNEGEDFQDEIIPLDDEKEPSPPPKKKSKPNPQAFPSLELSDNEGNNDDDDDDDSKINSYFINNNPTAKKAKAGSFVSFGLTKFILANIAKKVINNQLQFKGKPSHLLWKEEMWLVWHVLVPVKLQHLCYP